MNFSNAFIRKMLSLFVTQIMTKHPGLDSEQQSSEGRCARAMLTLVPNSATQIYILCLPLFESLILF